MFAVTQISDSSCVVLFLAVRRIARNDKLRWRQSIRDANADEFESVAQQRRVGWTQRPSSSQPMGVGHIQKRFTLAFLYFPTYNKRIQWCSSAVGQYERMAFTNWGGDHPTKGFSSYFEGDCVRLKRKDGWKWHETACFSPHRRYRFVCEYGKSRISEISW